MKIEKSSLLLGLVIGLILGGVAIGLLDANRPRPIFSKASDVDCAGLTTDMANVDAQIAFLKKQQGKDTYNNDAIAALQSYRDGIQKQYDEAKCGGALIE